jgi:DNA polymerase type B, organellar and viral
MVWNRDEHVSFWPTHDLPAKEVLRTVAYWDQLYNAVIIPSTGEVIEFSDVQQFIKQITDLNLLIFTYRILDSREFSPFKELIQDGRVKVYCSRTGGIVGIYIKSRRSAWIVERRIWDEVNYKPDKEFCETIDTVFRINSRSAATPGALGEKKIQETLRPGTRYSRPSHMLRTVILRQKIGGRADTLEEKRHYGTLYEEDLNGAYPYVSQLTIDPGETPTGFGSRNNTSPVMAESLYRYFSFFARCKVTIPNNSQCKFGPLAYRATNGKLTYPTLRGTSFDGWWWKEELIRARDAGYEVTIYQGWGWTRSSNWLEKWAKNTYKLRQETKGDVQAIIKKTAVAPFGRMGMSPESLTLVHKKDMIQDEQYIPITFKDATETESSISGYYIHISPNINSNKLTHIYSYVVMLARCELLDRVLAEEQSGNTVILTNYDSMLALHPTKLKQRRGKALGDWKERSLTGAYIYGPRSYKGLRDNVPIDNRPGVPLKRRN